MVNVVLGLEKTENPWSRPSRISTWPVAQRFVLCHQHTHFITMSLCMMNNSYLISKDNLLMKQKLNLILLKGQSNKSSVKYLINVGRILGPHGLTAMSIKMTVFCHVELCSLVETDQCLRYLLLHHQGNDGPDDGGNKHLLHTGQFPPGFTVQHPRRWSSSSH
jgi:hypothetical protein